MNTEQGTVDAEYRFGKPTVYLTPIELARLMIVRSRLGDTLAARAAKVVEHRFQPEREAHHRWAF